MLENPGHIPTKGHCLFTEPFTFYCRPTPGLDTNKKNSLHLYSLCQPHFSSVFSPSTSFNPHNSHKSKLGTAFLLNKWETEALLEVWGESEQKAIPRAAHAQPPESLVQLAQLPSLDSNLH